MAATDTNLGSAVYFTRLIRLKVEVKPKNLLVENSRS